MGTSFTSIHILNTDVSSVEIRLSNCQHTSVAPLSLNTQEDLKSKNFDTSFKELFNFLASFHSSKEIIVSFYSCQVENNVSVFSDFVTFENISEIAQNYFDDMPNIVIAVSLLDSDILKISFFKKGNLLTSLIKGSNLDVYGLSSCDLNFQKLKKVLPITQEQFDFIVSQSDLEKVCNLLADVFNLPIDKGLDSIDKNDPSFHKCEFII